MAWTCTTHLKDKYSCSMKFIKDDQIKLAFLTMMNKLTYANKRILKPLLASMRKKTYEMGDSDISFIDEAVKEGNIKLENLTHFLAKGYIDRPTFIKEQSELHQQIEDLESKKKTLIGIVSYGLNNLESLEDLINLTKRNAELTEFDDLLFVKIVSEIEIQSREEITIKLKCGLNLKERL